MKCEMCHERDAAEAIQAGKDGDELYVCRECAKAERLRRQKKSQNVRKRPGSVSGATVSVTRIGGDGEKPPPIVEAIVNAVHGVVAGFGAVAAEAAEKARREKEEKERRPFDFSSVDGEYVFVGGLHLEGLHLIGEMDAVKRAFSALELGISGVTADGINDAGHAYGVFCLPSDEEKARRVVEAVVEQERNARVRLAEEMPRVLDDAVCRALAVLKNCRLLSPGELFDLLSPLRLAATMHSLDGITVKKINRLAQSLDLSSYEDEMDGESRDAADAERADDMNRMFEDVVLSGFDERNGGRA